MSTSQSRNVTVNIVGDSSKLQGAMKSAGDSVQSTGTRITSAWKGVGSTIGSAFGSALEPVMGVLDQLGAGIDSLKQHASVGNVMIGVGAAASAAAAGLNMFGAKEQAADQQLGQAFSNVGANMDDFKGQIDTSIGSMAKFGYTGGDVKDALTQLVTATKNPTQALSLLQTAADLAAQKHESLGTAVTQLTQIVAGKGTRTLMSLGIQQQANANAAKQLAAATTGVKTAQDSLSTAQQKLSDLEAIDHGKKTLSIADHIALRNAQDNVTKAQGNLSDAMKKQQAAQEAATAAQGSSKSMLDAVAQATNGQASAAADTWTGKLKAVRAEIENQVATIGQKYGPAIQASAAGMTVLGGVTETVSGIIGKFKMGDEAAAVAEAAKTAAEGADTAAESAEAAGAVAVDAASLPLIATIGLIVLAVAAIGIGLYELVTHWSQVWGAIKAVAVDTWHGIDSDFIQPIEGFFEGIPNFIQKHWDLILDIILGPVGFIVGEVIKHFSDIIGFIASVPGLIGRFAGTMWNGISDAFKSMVNFIIGLWDTVADHTKISIPSVHIPLVGDVGGGSVGPLLPHLPFLAEGGIVTGPTLAMLGDNKARREAIVPLEKAGQFGFGGGGGDVVVPIELQIDGRTFGQATARYTRDALLNGTARNARKVGLA